MKRYVICFLFLACLAPGICAGQNMKGRIFNASDSTPLSGVFIFVDDYKRPLGSSYEGYFWMDSLAFGEHIFRLQYDNYRDTTFKITLDSAKTKDFVFMFRLICPYDTSTTKPHCAHCHKIESVIPIVYGYPSDVGMQRAERGEIHLGGCMISACDPKWYCTQCGKEF